jgi:hypothetical protein
VKLPTFFFCIGILCFVVSVIVNLVIIRNDISAIRESLGPRHIKRQKAWPPPSEEMFFGVDLGGGKDSQVTSFCMKSDDRPYRIPTEDIVLALCKYLKVNIHLSGMTIDNPSSPKVEIYPRGKE